MITQEEKIELIEQLEAKYRDESSRRNNPEVEHTILKEIALIAKGEKKYRSSLISEIYINNYHAAQRFLSELLIWKYDQFNWTEKSEFVKGFLNKNTINSANNRLQWGYIKRKFQLPTGHPTVDDFLEYYKQLDLTDEELTARMARYPEGAFYTKTADQTYEDTCFATYIKPKLKGKSSLLGLKKGQGLGSVLDGSVDNERSNNAHVILKFLLENSPNSITNLNKYLVYNYSDYQNSWISPKIESINVLLNHDLEKYENEIFDLVPTFSKLTDKYLIYAILEEKHPGNYHDQLREIGEETLHKYCGKKPNKNEYCHYERTRKGSLEQTYAKYLISKDKQQALIRLTEYTRDSHYINYTFPTFIEEEYKEVALPLLFNCLYKENSIVDKSYYGFFSRIFKILEEYDLTNHTEEIVTFGLNKTQKKNRILASNALEKYIDTVTVRAQELLKGKVNDRIFGAMILQHSTDPAIREQLMTLIDTERNDDTRDIMLEALGDIKFSNPMSRSELNDLIVKAEARKKLDKWGEKWIEEELLPKLYWNDGSTLHEKEIRFLFYRSKRVKGIGSDIEAKQLIELLDHKKSEKFALALIKAFQDSNADSKLKFYLVMAGLIGKDAVLTKLHTVFKQMLTNKRYRMAAMMVGSIAMVGSDKALRIVDMIARKFANKRRQIGEAAKEALNAAASELDITMDQLADRIIPNLGFEDHYYSFEAGEDSYRAFINKEFKLNYFNEDNKLRKSMPKEVSRETKADLKAIEKEIKEVVKTQKGRLENYLTTERTWAVSEWMDYYMSNPIMLIYVQRLLWGVYDDKHTLMTAFYCDDDIELYDVEDEEVDLEEGTYIKILHPLHMDDKLLTKWKDKVYDMDKEFEFEIINRTVTHVPEDESDQNFTNLLNRQEIPKGADYVAGFLVRKGWIKSAGDGGSLWFNKINEKGNINASANIEGPMAYYQGGNVQAIIYRISFTNYKDREKIKLKDVPNVFFSEVIADLKALINA